MSAQMEAADNRHLYATKPLYTPIIQKTPPSFLVAIFLLGSTLNVTSPFCLIYAFASYHGCYHPCQCHYVPHI
jgi:hypothetical protein